MKHDEMDVLERDQQGFPFPNPRPPTSNQPAMSRWYACRPWGIDNQHKGSEEKTLIDSQPKLLWENKDNTDISCWAPLS